MSENKTKSKAKNPKTIVETKAKKIINDADTKEVKKEISKPKKNKLKLVFLIIGILLIVAIAVIIIIKLTNHKDSYKDKATYSDAFFIKNKTGKYALFNDKGKQLSKFIYDSSNIFVNNSTVVYKEKDGYAILNNKGKEVVPFGKYGYISNYQGLYRVRSDKGYALIDSEGKVLIDDEDISVDSYGQDYPFAVVETEKEIIVYMYDGTKIYTFEKKSGAKDATVNHIDNYATVFYNGENIVFNLKTKKLIKSFKNKQHYCVNNATEDGKVLSFNACASWYESVEDNGYMLLINGKNLIDITKKCDNINVDGDVILCSKDNSNYFLNISKKKVEYGNKISSRVAYIDDENYVIRNDETYKLDFYKNNKKIKSIEAGLSATGHMNEKLYLLYVDNVYEYYNLEGKKAIDKSYKSASSFDENGLAKVSDDGKTFYLINTKGKKITDEYDYIYLENTYYKVKNSKDKYGVVDKKGKELLSTSYDSINIKLIRDKYYAVLTKNDKYEVYDLEDKKSIITSKDSVSLNDHYIKTSGSKTSYYTYDAKKIFSE